jgi:diguanylate cyclase (GGDEF)-like protein/PAS domain S-box-containing protein
MPSHVELERRVLELQSENLRLRTEIKRLDACLTKDVGDNAGKVGFSDSQWRQQEHYLRSMLSNIPAMIGYWDKNLHNRFSNKAYSIWFGISSEQLLGKHIRELLGETIFHLNLPYIEAALRGQSQQFERTIPKPGGSGVRYSLAEYIPDIIDGEVQGFFVQVSDITAIKQAEEQLQQLMLEQHAMLDTELIGIVKTVDRRIVWKNKAINQIFGYESGELLGESTRFLYPDDSSYQQFGEEAYPILRSGKSYRKQIEMIRKNGDWIWIDVSGAMLSEIDHEFLWMMSDLTLLKKREVEVEHIAYHDILTGLPNRLLMTDRLNQALAQAVRLDNKLAVCYLDLDGFKPVNDTYGHAAGDKLLKEVAKRMEHSVRANDSVGRMGGDEFVILLTNLENDEEHQVVLQRVLEAINRPFTVVGSRAVKVGASIGIAMFPADGLEADMLIRHADRAMYDAKQSGRNRISLYQEDRMGDH